MHKYLLAGVSAIAVLMGGFTAYGQDLMFKKGEGGFNWASLDEFKAAHTGLDGQALTIWDAWSEPGDKAQWDSVVFYRRDRNESAGRLVQKLRRAGAYRYRRG
jgi:alpha-glucoside transport system substrate-binding protein